MYYLLLVLFALGVFLDVYKYNTSTYKMETQNRYLKVMFNKGLYGEYLTFRILDGLKGYKKITVNTYIPKKNGETTEIDLICIHETGIYCIESKNYGGWIFGDEKSPYWTQSLKGGVKNKFLNPIMQNEGHIKHLKECLSETYQGAFYSVIVFSKRCELKKIKLISTDLLLMRRQFLRRRMHEAISKRNSVLSHEQINALYNQLSQFTCASDALKQQHIETIAKKKVG